MTPLFIIIIAVVAGLAAVLFNSDKRRKSSIYLIRKGRHFSVRTEDWLKLPFKPGIVRGNMIIFDVMFLRGAYYNAAYDDSIHKLYGICYGFDPHYRSVRVGWRHVGDGYIEFFTYSYEAGKRAWRFMYRDKANGEIYRFLIGRKNSEEVEVVMWKYSDALGNVMLLNTSDVKCTSVSDALKFRMYPYYGGTKKAPATISILIEEKV